MGKTGMRLLGVSGSPRLKSTHFAVNEALEYARERHGVEAEYFSVHKKPIGFCLHCDDCVQKEAGLHSRRCHGRALPRRCCARMPGSSAVPSTRGNVSGQLKTDLDRCRAVVAREPAAFRNKVGMPASAVGGDRSGGQEPTLRTIDRFLHHQPDDPGREAARSAPISAPPCGRATRARTGCKADEEGMAAMHSVVDRLVTWRATASPVTHLRRSTIWR